MQILPAICYVICIRDTFGILQISAFDIVVFSRALKIEFNEEWHSNSSYYPLNIFCANTEEQSWGHKSPKCQCELSSPAAVSRGENDLFINGQCQLQDPQRTARGEGKRFSHPNSQICL